MAFVAECGYLDAFDFACLNQLVHKIHEKLNPFCMEDHIPCEPE